MLEVLGGFTTAGAGGRRVDVAPRRVCTQIAPARSHLVEATRSEFVEAHERMGLERGAVQVAGQIRRGLFPLFHQEAPAQELKLGVGAAPRGGRVQLAKQVL